MTTESHIEQGLIDKLKDLKYTYRSDICDRDGLEKNFREKFEALNCVHLTDTEFARLLDQIVTPDVFAAARHLRERNSFDRDDGKTLFYTLVNIREWCKNTFEVVNQLRINTSNSHHRFDVILLINGVPVVQIELKTLAISPRRAMQQIVDYKNDPGNGYTKTLLCFLQLFIVSNRSDTWYFANNNSRHFSFNADERFLPLYQFAGEDNKKITHLDSFAEKFLAKCTLGEMISRYMVQRLLSDDYANKVIVTTIQKLGLALDGSSKRNYKERLEPLRKKRMVFIFDECHRSQFGENHKAIKEFFPNAQLFGFTGTPIFSENANYQQVEDQQASCKTTEDIFQQRLHAYTITHAIEDRNVLRFHIDFYKPEGRNKPQPGEPLARKAIIEAILEKHDAATYGRKFNTLLATASINDAIAYHKLFKTIQDGRQTEDGTFQPLNIACVFSPPAEGNKDVQQLQEDLPQEKADNLEAPAEKKAALKAIIADYNAHYATNHRIDEFDLYYQDVQKRIKDQQYPNQDLPHAQKIDIVIVVDMLLTGFDSKFLNTLYVDKNLRYHGLIQAFSRTNRVLNDTKPYGNILDFRQQQDAVDAAITLFSGEQIERAKTIWLVDKAPVVIGKLETAVKKLDEFMHSQGLASAPEEVPNLKGNKVRGQFINLFKEVQRFKTQLDQYTDLTHEDAASIEQVIPREQLQAFCGVYLETARRLQDQKGKGGGGSETEQLDFEFVLFALAMIDYDYIMTLITSYSQQTPGKQKMTRTELIGLIDSEAQFLEVREDIADYIGTLKSGEGLKESDIRQGYETFKAEKNAHQLAEIAEKHGLATSVLQAFMDGIMQRMIFDGEQLTDLLAPLGLNWKSRRQKELALMEELIPVLHKLAQGREISGLGAYEQ